MRLRNFTDGAVSINLQMDDISNNIELYDHKGINLEPYTFNEKVVDNHEAYVESLHLQQYFKIQPVKKDPTDKKDPTKPKKIMIQDKVTKDFGKEKVRRTEDDIYEKFEKEMQEMISRVSNRIAIFFLFAQGLLAGICLTNIFLLYEFQTLTDFTSFYSLFAREIFDFIYLFTFISLIGNGVKFFQQLQEALSTVWNFRGTRSDCKSEEDNDLFLRYLYIIYGEFFHANVLD